MIYKIETDEKSEMLELLRAQDVRLAIWDFSVWLRDTIKYQERDGLEFFNEIREELIERFKEIPGDYIR